MVFVNDTPIPRGTLEMMGEAGEVLNRAGLSLARSYREAITLPVARRRPSSVRWVGQRGVRLTQAGPP